MRRVQRRKVEFKANMGRFGTACKWAGWIAQLGAIFQPEPIMNGVLTLVNTGFQVADWRLQKLANDPPRNDFDEVMMFKPVRDVRFNLDAFEPRTSAITMDLLTAQLNLSRAGYCLLLSLERLQGATQAFALPYVAQQLKATDHNIQGFSDAVHALDGAHQRWTEIPWTPTNVSKTTFRRTTDYWEDLEFASTLVSRDFLSLLDVDLRSVISHPLPPHSAMNRFRRFNVARDFHQKARECLESTLQLGREMREPGRNDL